MASRTLARIIAGCYEEMIVGYDVVLAGEDETGEVTENEMNSEDGRQNDRVSPPLRLKLSFTDHPHSGSVRCIAASKGIRIVCTCASYFGTFHMSSCFRSRIGEFGHFLTMARSFHTIGASLYSRISGGMVASGSNDETIHVYNANTGRDVGSLMSHGGSVTSLQFHGAKYLISGSEDNNVVVWRTKPKWEVLKTLRGHKGHVESVAVHPSGKEI